MAKKQQPNSETQPILNVRSFGALGNSNHDDSKAIQAAIDAAPHAGGQVFLPAGTYIVSQTLKLKEGVNLIGEGPGSILRASANARDIDVVQIGDGETTVSFAGVQNLRIASDGQKTGGAAIKLNKAYRIWLDKLAIESQYRALHIQNSTIVWFSSSDVRNTLENAITIESDYMQGFEWYIDKILCDNSGVKNEGAGLYWNGGESLHITDSNFQRFKNGLVVCPSEGRESRFAFIDSMLCDFSSDNNVHISNSGNGAAIGLTFTNSWSGTATNYGVLVDQQDNGLVQGVRWSAGKIFHNGLAGVRIAKGQDVRISDCDIIGNSQTEPGKRHGVEVAKGVSHFSIQGCRIGGGFQQGDTQGCAILIDKGSSDYYSIINNDCHTNMNGVKINDRGRGSNKVVANNIE